MLVADETRRITSSKTLFPVIRNHNRLNMTSSRTVPLCYNNILNYVVISVILSSLTTSANAIKCFQCGLYIAPDSPYPVLDGPAPGKIFPCTNMTQGHIKECKPSETACMKYVNKELTVYLCAERCIEDVSLYSEREIHCCSDDACNGSFKVIPILSSLVMFLFILSPFTHIFLM